MKSEGFVMLIELFPYSWIIAFDTSERRFLNGSHLMSEDILKAYVHPDAAVVRSFALDPITECRISGLDAFDGSCGEDSVNWFGTVNMSVWSIVAVHCHDNVSHVRLFEKGLDVASADVFVGVHHQDNMFPILLPVLNCGREIVEFGLSWFAVNLSEFEESFALLYVNRLELNGILEVWAVSGVDA